MTIKQASVCFSVGQLLLDVQGEEIVEWHVVPVSAKDQHVLIAQNAGVAVSGRWAVPRTSALAFEASRGLESEDVSPIAVTCLLLLERGILVERGIGMLYQ